MVVVRGGVNFFSESREGTNQQMWGPSSTRLDRGPMDDALPLPVTSYIGSHSPQLAPTSCRQHVGKAKGHLAEEEARRQEQEECAAHYQRAATD
jgi:hypothetical protein